MIKLLNKLGEKIKKHPFIMEVLQDKKKRLIAAIIITIPIYLIYSLLDAYVFNPEVQAEVKIIQEAITTATKAIR